MLDVIVMGAGPIGINCAIEAQRRELSALVLEKGALVNSFVNYPTDLELFSTPELLEIAGHPFISRNYKPVRAEAIEYYRRVAEVERVNFKLYEEVLRVEGEIGAFIVTTSEDQYACRNVVIATGFFDVPNLLNVPGEELPHVLHYYKEPYPFTGQNVTVIGARNSAAKVALDCLRHGANVTLVIRGPSISDSVKYWIKPDLENRIKEGRIGAYFNTSIARITPNSVHLMTPEGAVELPSDWVLAMTGYQPNFILLERLGIELGDDIYRTPIHDKDTMETSRAGVYLAGVVCGGLNTRVWFVENSRVHSEVIMEHIVSRQLEETPASGR